MFRSLSLEQIRAHDDGDNLLTKVTPFEDDFNDGDYAGWSVASSTWDASNTYATRTTGLGSLYRPVTDGDVDLQFSYYSGDTSESSHELSVYPRKVEGSGYERLEIFSDSIELWQLSGGVYSQLAANSSATTTPGTWYDVHLVANGPNIEVWRAERGQMMTLVLSTSSAAFLTTDQICFTPSDGSTFRIDDIRIIADGLSNTTAYAYNTANEMASMTDYNGTTTFAYDEWGRMTSKTRGSATATYAYNYGGKLTSVASIFPDEGNVTYDYGGDGRRRERTAAGATTQYNWDGGCVINEEDGLGSLTRSYVRKFAEITGSDTNSGTIEYNLHDVTGSVSAKVAHDQTLVKQFEYSPMGDILQKESDNQSFLAFGGERFDPIIDMYSTSYANYIPSHGRSISPNLILASATSRTYARTFASRVSGLRIIVRKTKDADDCDVAGRYLWCEGKPPAERRACRRTTDRRCASSTGERNWCCAADRLEAIRCSIDAREPLDCAIDLYEANQKCLRGGGGFAPPPSCRPRPDTCDAG